MLFLIAHVSAQQRTEGFRAEPRGRCEGAQPVVAEVAHDDEKVFLPRILWRTFAVARPALLVVVSEPAAHRRHEAVDWPAEDLRDGLAIHPLNPAAFIAPHVNDERCGGADLDFLVADRLQPFALLKFQVVADADVVHQLARLGRERGEIGVGRCHLLR